MTPVLGCHVAFYDPLSLFSVNLFVGASPWSGNDWKNRFHAAAYIKGGKVRGTIGAIEAEQGYRFSASAYTYLADGRFFPSIDISGDLGFLLPVGEHNAFWLKGAAGQAFGDSNSALGNSYFGGFRNNYVDNGDINRYRTASAFPGARIDQIAAHSYAKMTLSFGYARAWGNGLNQGEFMVSLKLL